MLLIADMKRISKFMIIKQEICFRFNLQKQPQEVFCEKRSSKKFRKTNSKTPEAWNLQLY